MDDQSSMTSTSGRWTACFSRVVRTEAVSMLLIAASLACWTGPGCRAQTERARPVTKRDRILGIKANVGRDGDFEKTFNESMEAGNKTEVIPQDWNELETAPGEFKPETNFLAIADMYYGARRIPIHLALRPVHTSQKVVPGDLMDIPFDDPRTIQRFERLLDWVATQMPKVELTSLAIGSEVDIYLWGDDERWKEWTNFYATVAPYARRTFPGTLISCETTAAAFGGTDLARVRKLHEHSDAIGVSYYPMEADLSGVRPPEAVHQDFDTVVNAIAEKPVLYYQIGYPSGPALGSSARQQAVFVREAFRAWDQHADRILMLYFQWMHETPPAGLDRYTEYYKYDTPGFRAFLGSLGLQSWSGEPKPAWFVLKKEARARGFVR